MRKILIAMGAVALTAATILSGVSTANAGWRYGWGNGGWGYRGWGYRGWGYGRWGYVGWGAGYVAATAPVVGYVYRPTAYYHYRNYGYYPYNYAAYPVLYGYGAGYWGGCGC